MYKYRVQYLGDDEVHTIEPDENLGDVIMEMLTQHSPPIPVLVSAIPVK